MTFMSILYSAKVDGRPIITMGSRVNICSVNILDNPSTFLDDFKLEITFEAFERLPHDLEWELVYVGSPTSSEHDQLLDSVVVGPTPEGRHKFIFKTACPKTNMIPATDLVGVTVLLLRVKYFQQEFMNLGWYTKVEYTDPVLIENPPTNPIFDKLTRTVLTDDVRVTSYSIKWDENQEEEFPPEEANPDQDLLPEDDDEEDEPEEEDSDVDAMEQSKDEEKKEEKSPNEEAKAVDEDTETSALSAPLVDSTNV